MNTKQQPVAADLTEDQRQARAFGEYLKDCDKHAIQTDTASAFLWGWNAALGSAPDTPVPTYESVRDAASAVYDAHMAATPVPAPGAIKLALDALEILDRRPRPMCRDCADENGTCPGSGLPCDVQAVIRDARAAIATPVQPVPASEPFGYYVYVPAEQRGEFVFDLDEALDDLTNCECDVTELRASAPATPAPIEPVKVTDSDRIDWLEERINTDGQINLHDGAHPHGTGLGLRPGWVVRTLREAIDQARSAPATQDKGEGA